MKKVLILVDNGLRDLLSCRLLEEAFAGRGLRTYLCNKRNMRLALRKYEPDCFVIPRADLFSLPEISKCTKLYVIPCEGGRLTFKTMMSVFLGRVHKGGDVMEKNSVRYDQYGRQIKKFDFIRKVYLWGPKTYDFLKHSGYFDVEQLMTAGCVKLDVYRGYKHIGQKKKGKDFVLGVAFSAKAASAFSGRVNYARLLHDFDKKSHLPVVPKGRHWEDFAWRDFAILRRMMMLIKRYVEECEGTVYMRVGPLENPNDYYFLQEIYPGRVKIQADKGELYEFIDSVDVVLTCWSTLGIEALLAGVPVIAIPFTMDKEHLLSHVDPEANGFNTYLPCYHLPESEDEVMEMINRAKNKTLPVTPDPGHLSVLLKEMYNWPQDKDVSSLIADDVIKDMEGFKSEKKCDWGKVVSFGHVLDRLLCFMPGFLKSIFFSFLMFVQNLKNLSADLMSASYIGNKRHHLMRNQSVERVIERHKKTQA